MAHRLIFLSILCGHLLYSGNCSAPIQSSANVAPFLTYLCDDDLLKTAVNKMEFLSLKLENYNLRMQSELMAMKEQLLREVKTNLELLDSKITTKCNEESKNVISSCTEAMRQENRKYAESGIQSELMSMKEQLLREVKTNLELLDSKITTKCNEECKNVVGAPPPTKKPSSCTEAMRQENGKYAESGVYELYLPEFLQHPFYVYCLRDPDDGEPWTIIQRRQSNDTYFYRGWFEYEHGFGDLNANFFLGLDKIHALTNSRSHDLWFQLEDFENEKRVAKYDNFAIGNAQDKYELIAVGQYSGTAGDSFSYHLGQKFTTKDKHNDEQSYNCAVRHKGAWWYNHCHESHLNGLYLGGKYPASHEGRGVVWYSWRGFHYSLKYAHMAIRPKYYH